MSARSLPAGPAIVIDPVADAILGAHPADLLRAHSIPVVRYCSRLYLPSGCSGMLCAVPREMDPALISNHQEERDDTEV